MSEPVGYPSGYDPEFLTPEEAILLKGTTPGVNMADYAKRTSAHARWVVQGLVPAGGISAIYGPPKRARKSFLAIQMARAIAAGEPFLGTFGVSEPATVLFVQLDTPQSIWQERYEQLETAGVTFPDEVKQRIITVDATDIFPLDIGSPKGQAFVRYHVRKFKPAVVIFDVLRKIFKGSEDDNAVIEQAMSDMKSAAFPAAVLFITHAKKTTQGYDGGTMNELRGSSHIGGSCDTVMRVKPPTRQRKFTQLCVEGRAVPTVDYPMRSLDNQFYELIVDEWANAIERISNKLDNQEFDSISDAARYLATATGKSIDTCRMAITRFRQAAEED